MRHIDLMCKVTLATGSIVGYAYGMEFFIAWYSGNPYERFAFMNRAVRAVLVGLLDHDHLQRDRAAAVLVQEGPARTWWLVFIISILVNIGMWFERFVIIVISLHRDFLPANWGYFKPTWVDICTFVGTFGLFFTLFLLFMRFLPMIAIAEVKGVTPQADPHHPLGGAKRRRCMPRE